MRDWASASRQDTIRFCTWTFTRWDSCSQRLSAGTSGHRASVPPASSQTRTGRQAPRPLLGNPVFPQGLHKLGRLQKRSESRVFPRINFPTCHAYWTALKHLTLNYCLPKRAHQPVRHSISIHTRAQYFGTCSLFSWRKKLVYIMSNIRKWAPKAHLLYVGYSIRGEWKH